MYVEGLRWSLQLDALGLSTSELGLSTLNAVGWMILRREGGSGDLDMTRMEWELLAFHTSWELDFCFDRGKGRHFFPSQVGYFCVLGWAQGFYSF